MTLGSTAHAHSHRCLEGMREKIEQDRPRLVLMGPISDTTISYEDSEGLERLLNGVGQILTPDALSQEGDCPWPLEWPLPGTGQRVVSRLELIGYSPDQQSLILNITLELDSVSHKSGNRRPLTKDFVLTISRRPLDSMDRQQLAHELEDVQAAAPTDNPSLLVVRLEHIAKSTNIMGDDVVSYARNISLAGPVIESLSNWTKFVGLARLELDTYGVGSYVWARHGFEPEEASLSTRVALNPDRFRTFLRTYFNFNDAAFAEALDDVNFAPLMVPHRLAALDLTMERLWRLRRLKNQAVLVGRPFLKEISWSGRFYPLNVNATEAGRFAYNLGSHRRLDAPQVLPRDYHQSAEQLCRRLLVKAEELQRK